MLFGPNGLPIGLEARSEDVDRALLELKSQVAAGLTGSYLARAADGFALLAASPKRFTLGAGVAIGVNLSAVNLAALRNRCFELLGADAVVASRLTGDADFLSESQTDEIDEGFRYLTEQLGQGRSAFYLGKAPKGYALLVASLKCFDVGSGIGIGVGLSEQGLKLLRSRVVELLHGPDVARRLDHAS
jgi:hypothetical protein